MLLYAFTCLLVFTKAHDDILQKDAPPSPEDNIVALTNGGGRWTVPLNCETSCSTIEWQLEPEGYITFTVQGPLRGYISFAISENTDMEGGDDCYYCARLSQSSNDVTIVSAQLTGFVVPETSGLAENSSFSETDKRMTCIIVRPISVTKNISGSEHTWNVLTDAYNLLYAEGEISDNGALLYHFTTRKHTHGAFDLGSNEAYPTEETTTMVTEPALPTSMNVMTVSPEDDIVATSTGGGIWNLPSEGEVNRFVSWRPRNIDGVDMIEFTLNSQNVGYAAVAISLDKGMGNDDCYYCRVGPGNSEITVESGYLIGEVRPKVIGQLPNDQVVSSSIMDNVLSCTFLRPISVTKNVNNVPVTWDLGSTNFNILFAEGTVNADASIEIHSYRKHTHGVFSIVSNAGYNQQVTSPPVTTTSATSTISVSKFQFLFGSVVLLIAYI